MYIYEEKYFAFFSEEESKNIEKKNIKCKHMKKP